MQITRNISNSTKEEKDTVQNSLIPLGSPTPSQSPSGEPASGPINSIVPDDIAYASVRVAVSLARDTNRTLGKA